MPALCSLNDAIQKGPVCQCTGLNPIPINRADRLRTKDGVPGAAYSWGRVFCHNLVQRGLINGSRPRCLQHERILCLLLNGGTGEALVDDRDKPGRRDEAFAPFPVKLLSRARSYDLAESSPPINM